MRTLNIPAILALALVLLSAVAYSLISLNNGRPVIEDRASANFLAYPTSTRSN